MMGRSDAELAALLRMLQNEKPPYTAAKQRKYGLPVVGHVAEPPDTVTILLTDRCAHVLAEFTPEARAATERYRWGSEVAWLLSAIEEEHIPDLPPGALSDRERQRVNANIKLQDVPRPVRDALEPYRPAAEEAFAWADPWPGPRGVKTSDVIEYLAERVRAFRNAPPRRRPGPKRKVK